MKHDCDGQWFPSYMFYIYRVNTVSTFSYALCGSFPNPLCVVWIWMFLTKKYNNYSLFKSYLNDRKNATPYMYCAFQVLIVFQVCFCLMEHICPLYLRSILIAINVCVCLVFLQVLSLPQCTVPLLYFTLTCITCLFWSWIQCFFGSSGYLWWRQAEMTHIKQ